ncbi:FkbM family methyltransferase [Pseudomonas hefeiensis]|uniref:FkbM family methyltransferase n=1 Tax=Pseudomonas hefeiensis TaxID=2738125 RepID=A0ABY9GC58_9PSED|nr:MULTISPECIES: FkbM family methyltransferase [unclassified Pseudomonas]WLH13112.1 FkbM family methyltransferase [Pseudomonas sp. FP205]WLH96179.1 FkbM family methyltransferase [Pseudomonas sp. FP53]WLI40449.1 FkbM family methyltransferase [Pseudomonas sp. FP821]
MTFISYAQNFEDIRLWRALKSEKNGFYLDVGANHPTEDSVTRAFYDHGWRGINIEPVQAYYDALCQARPNDINLQCVAGENADGLTFYTIADTGLSTVEASVAQQHRDAGMKVSKRTVQSRTLTSICEQYAQDRPIHFLKIDVEGHEETVLRGMDFTRWRPWIILIETPWARDQTWENLVTDAGYQSILFDGLNTFYLAEEHLALKPAFDIPPCNLDEFQFCKGHKFSHPLSEPDQQLSAALQRAERAEAQLHALQNSRTWRTLQKVRSLVRRA